LDPFNGSGTTCVAAKQLNRRYLGIDTNQEYCDLACQRLENGAGKNKYWKRDSK